MEVLCFRVFEFVFSAFSTFDFSFFDFSIFFFFFLLFVFLFRCCLLLLLLLFEKKKNKIMKKKMFRAHRLIAVPESSSSPPPPPPPPMTTTTPPLRWFAAFIATGRPALGTAASSGAQYLDDTLTPCLAAPTRTYSLPLTRARTRKPKKVTP